MAMICLSQDMLKNWDKTGRTEFMRVCRSLSEHDSSVKLLQKKNLKRAVYEICFAVSHNQLRVENAVSLFVDLKDYIPTLPSTLADVLGIVDVETSCSDETLRERFVSFVSALRHSVVPDSLLKERLDQDSLELVGLVGSQIGFNQKYVKTKTRLYYKQQKFNLLREESEGYSKLITEHNSETIQKVSWEQVLQNIKSLIGCFDLDPNRVLDIILEAFECHPEDHVFYIPLLRAYIIDKLTLCHILGFKFHFRETADWSVPKSLYTCAALLLKYKLVDLEDLYPYLHPLDSEIIPFSNQEMADAKAYARKLNTVVLSDKKDEDKKEDDQQMIDLRENNQKLGLCEALLEIGAWDNAKQIFDRLPDNFAVVHTSISQALCLLIHRVIEPVYEKHIGLHSVLAKKRVKSEFKGDFAQARTFQQLYQLAMPMLSYLDPVLMIKIMRLAKTFMNKRQNGEVDPDDKDAYYGFLNVLEEVLLPSLSLLPSNCSMSEELWNLLKLYPYEIRYRLYGTWKNESYFMYPVLIRTRSDCLERAKYIMKRLSKETVKPSGRQLGKLSHNNPGIVFEYFKKLVLGGKAKNRSLSGAACSGGRSGSNGDVSSPVLDQSSEKNDPAAGTLVKNLPAGLHNYSGHMCFVNAVLQALKAIPTFQQNVLCLGGSTKNPLVVKLGKLFRDMETLKVASGVDIGTDMNTDLDHDGDSAEFLDEMLLKLSRCDEIAVENLSLTFKIAFVSQDVTESFGFLFSTNIKSVQRGVEDYFRTTQTRCLLLPHCLIIRITRTFYDSRGKITKSQRRVKMDRFLDLRNHLLAEETNATFELRSVIVHEGEDLEKDVCHMVAYAVNNNEWYHFSDSLVTPCVLNQVLTEFNEKNCTILAYIMLVTQLLVLEQMKGHRRGKLNQ